MNINLSTTLIFKGKITDDRYVRIIRVYDNHFIWYEESPNEGGISREVKVLNKADILMSFGMLIDDGLIDAEHVNNFLR